jgi:deazaflavin-dependent oxidoreductase (nitroreductase family)
MWSASVPQRILSILQPRPYSASAPQTRYVRWIPKAHEIKRIGKLHVCLYRATGGLVGGRMDGLDILLLTTVGRKTGKQRTVPLPFFRDGERYVLIASFGGNVKNPAWLANITANPGVHVQVGRTTKRLVGRVTSGDEREALWRSLTSAYPRYLRYQALTASSGRSCSPWLRM